MSKKLYEETNIQNIANAIRSKNGSSNTYKVNEMASAINNIPTGGNLESLYVDKNGTYTNTKGYSPVEVDVFTGTRLTYGNHVDENGVWHKPEEWDDIESIDLTDKHESYILCGTKINDYPFVRLRVYGGGTIKWSYGHVSNGVYTIHQNSTETTISSGAFIELLLSEIEDDYIVIRITATTYLSSVTTQIWSTSAGAPSSYPATYNCVLMRYQRAVRGTSLAFTSFYLESDKQVDFGTYYEGSSQAITLSGAYNTCYNLQRVVYRGTDFSKLNITTIYSMFGSCYSLSELSTVEGKNIFDFSGSIRSSCTSLSSVFNNCMSLRSKLILKNWDVSNVTSMVTLFSGCRNLEAIEGLETWTKAPKCTNISNMFYNCPSLKGTIDLSSLYLGYGTGVFNAFGSVFYYCLSVNKIILNNTNLSKITSVNNAFNYCGAKEIVWDTNFTPPSNLCTNFAGLFAYSCISEVNFDGWNFTGSTGGNLNQLLYTAYGVKKIEFNNITYTRTSTWADASSSSTSFIRSCVKLESADFSWFDMSICSGTAIHLYGFRDCNRLREFYPPKNICKKFDLTNDNALSHDSLMRVINNLKTVTTTTQLVIGTYNLAKLSDDDKAIATGKGWTLA